MLGLVKGSQNVEAVVALLNHMASGEVQVRLTEKTGYAPAATTPSPRSTRSPGISSSRATSNIEAVTN